MSCFQENLELLAERNALLAWEIRKSSPIPWTPPTLDIEGEGVQCLYGLAFPKPKGSLVMIDHDIGKWVTWLSHPEATPLLKNKNVHFYAVDSHLFTDLLRKFSCQKIEVSATPAYKDHPLYSTVQNRILEENSTFSRIAYEYTDNQTLFYENFYSNLSQLHRAQLGSHLFGQFKNVPAIICGAGPSLNPKLLDKERALIFAPGSALKIVQAHFGVSLDPHVHQYQRTQNCNIPMFYRSRWNKDALRDYQGPLLYLNSNQPIDAWFEKQLGIHQRCLDEGENVVCLTVELARALGCDPIVFVGMDLAYTNERRYPDGIIEDPLLKDPEPLIEQTDIHGQKVKTHWKWVAESRWISEYAEKCDTTFLNATQNGLGFKGIPNVPMPQFSKRQIEIPHAPCIDASNLPTILQNFRQSIKRCQDLVSQPSSALTEVELQEEAAYEAILELPYRVFNLSNFDTVLKWHMNRSHRLA